MFTHTHEHARVHMHTHIHTSERHRHQLGSWALTDAQHDERRVFPAGQQQEVDEVVGNEAEAQDHAAPLLEAFACGERW